jgi:hypothetical protein
MPDPTRCVRWLAILASLSTATAAQERSAPPAEPVRILGAIPIREVTIFKDGHAFVVHEGTKPVNAAGDVVLDELPQPVLGTFWPYAGGKARLAAAAVGRRRVLVERTALDVRSLLEANPGAEVYFVDQAGRHSGTIVGVPIRSSDELARTGAPGAGESLPEKGGVIMVRTVEGVRAVPLDGIREVTFRGDYRKTLAGEEFRNLLTLDLDWGGVAPEATATVGMGYLQKGLRWIPSYHVTIDGAGKAVVKLEATIINDLADLSGVTANLVIGVPAFAFQGMLDPISMQAVLANVAARQELDRSAFSNALMSQRVSVRDAMAAEAPSETEPEVAGGARNEDLFVFTVRNLTLRRGERMVVPVAEAALGYQDVYTLTYEFSPPPEVRPQVDAERSEQLARRLESPPVTHVLRIKNTGAHPLTTAPAMIVRDGRLLCQSTMTYTSAGGEVDLPVTAAVDVKARRTDKETRRTPDAVKWQGSLYYRVDLEGSIELTSYKDKPVVVEVTKEVLGVLDSAAPEGATSQLSLQEFWSRAGRRPWWWHWYGWPGWWAALNGVGQAKWTVTVPPGKAIMLSYRWHYFGG